MDHQTQPPQPSPEVSNSSAVSPSRSPGRPPVLDHKKRRQILAVLANGNSRRTAALYVGCSPGTITQTIRRDPEFAEEVARAERTADIELVRAIRDAAREGKYWRAAAWLLERRNPADFLLRRPDTFTLEELEERVGAMANLVAQAVPAEYHDRIAKQLGQFGDTVAAWTQPVGSLTSDSLRPESPGDSAAPHQATQLSPGEPSADEEGAAAE